MYSIVIRMGRKNDAFISSLQSTSVISHRLYINTTQVMCNMCIIKHSLCCMYCDLSE